MPVSPGSIPPPGTGDTPAPIAPPGTGIAAPLEGHPARAEGEVARRGDGARTDAGPRQAEATPLPTSTDPETRSERERVDLREQAIHLLRTAHDRGAAERAMAAVARLPHEEALRTLREEEARRALSLPGVGDLAEAERALREASGRAAAVRTISLLGGGGDNPMVYAEVLVRFQGERQDVRLRIAYPGRDGKGRRRDRDDGTTVGIALDLTRLGPVRGGLRLDGQRLDVGLWVRDHRVQTHLVRHERELQEALRKLGLEARVRFSTGPAVLPEGTPEPEPVVSGSAGGIGTSIAAVDVKA